MTCGSVTASRTNGAAAKARLKARVFALLIQLARWPVEPQRTPRARFPAFPLSHSRKPTRAVHGLPAALGEPFLIK